MRYPKVNVFATSVLALCACFASAQNVPIASTITDGQGNAIPGSFLKFQLWNCGPNFPTVQSTGVVLVKQTFNLIPNALGVVSGSVIPNDVIVCGNVLYATRWNVTPMKDAVTPLTSTQRFNICSASAPLTMQCGNVPGQPFNPATAQPDTDPPPAPGYTVIVSNPLRTQTIKQPLNTSLKLFGTVDVTGVTWVGLNLIGTNASLLQGLNVCSTYAPPASVPPDGYVLTWSVANNAWCPAAGGGNSANAVSIQGVNVAVTAPTANQFLGFNGVNWLPTTITGFLPSAGGTITGPLVLPGNAVSGLQATPLQQVTTLLGSKADLVGAFVPPAQLGSGSTGTGTNCLRDNSSWATCGGAGSSSVVGTFGQIAVTPVPGPQTLSIPAQFNPPGTVTLSAPLNMIDVPGLAPVWGFQPDPLCLFQVGLSLGQLCNLNGVPVWNGQGAGGVNQELMQVRTGQPTPSAGSSKQFNPNNQDFENTPPPYIPVSTAFCPQADDTCFAVTANNATYQVSGNFLTRNIIKVVDVLHATLQCTLGTTIQPLNTTSNPIIQIVGGSYVTLKDCEIAGYTYTAGTVTVTQGSATATLSVAPSAAVAAMMAGGTLFVPGTAPLPDVSPSRGQGGIISSVSGTTILLTAGWGVGPPVAKSASNVPFHISYGSTGLLVQAIDENCSLTNGSIGGDGTKVTVSVAAGVNCKLQNQQTVLVYGTGTFGSGASADSYNRTNQGPISIVSGCTGVGACSFTYLSTLNLGTGTAGTIALKTDHIYFEHNNIHDGGGMTAASQAADTQDAMTEVWMTNNSMSYCSTNCYAGNRMSHLHLSRNHCDHPGMKGTLGDCYAGQADIALTEDHDEADVESNNADGFHAVFLYGGSIGDGLDIHDVPLRNSGGTNGHNFHCDLCQYVNIGKVLIGANPANGTSQLASGKSGFRIEAPAGGSLVGASILQVGGAGITVNARLENLGNGFNGANQAVSTASCVTAGANGCTTPSGHQWFNAEDQIAHTTVTITPGDGSNASYTMTVSPLTLATGVTCTTATTPACVTDGAHILEGTNAQKICPNPNADNCGTGGVFPAGRIAFVNFTCTAGVKCVGSNINNLSDFVFRIGIGAPAAVNLAAGDLQFCVSSLPNLVAPEACQDVPFIKANAFVRIPFIFSNYGQLFDNPGIASAGFVARATGGTSYIAFWTDDWAVDVPNQADGTFSVTGNTLYRPQGTCFGISGGARVDIVGNNCTDPGYTGKGPAPFYGIYVDDSVSGGQLDQGTAMVGGLIKNNVFKHTIGVSTSGGGGDECIKLNVGTGGSIKGLIVDPAGCEPSEWNNIFDPTTATNYSPVDQGQCTLGTNCAAIPLYFLYKTAPNCYATWGGGGALTGFLKAVANVGAVPNTLTITSSVGGDNGVINWTCPITP